MHKELYYFLKIRKKLLDSNEFAIYTQNKLTGWTGRAFFATNREYVINVYEGNPDGSDDKELSFPEFLQNYNFFIGLAE